LEFGASLVLGALRENALNAPATQYFMTRAGIALGSNLGDRLRNFQMARDGICAFDGVTPPILQSAIYESAPIDCEPGAGSFYNAVIEIGFAKSAEALLQALQTMEQSLGRARDHARNVSRTIDLDLLYFGEQRRTGAGLQLPHPRMAEREFVLRPLADIAPELRLPGAAASVREILAQIPASGSIKCVTSNW
jgi:2-amino-4-hydroxy-6-hydroxymethyldihydropteridine diphosphokinase